MMRPTAAQVLGSPRRENDAALGFQGGRHQEGFSMDSSPYSHPDQAVRHSYPLAIQNGDFSTALSLIMRTLPYAGARFGVLFGTSLVTAIWWVVMFGGAGIFSKISSVLGVFWFVGCAVAYGYVWRTLVRYFLYLLKAGHIAVLTELITKGSVGDGREPMFDYGKRIVTERFGQMNAMFALDLLVSGIIGAFNRTLDWIAGLLPVPGLRDVTSVVNRVVRSATTYIDETILSYSLARGDEDVFRAARDGVVYYAQNSKEVLKTGIWIVVLDKVVSFFTFIVMFLPAVLVGMVLPHAVKEWGVLFTIGMSAMFAWAVRGAFIQPLFLVMIMVKFHASVKGQPINLEWDAQLSSISDKFVELKNRIGQPTSTATAHAPGIATP
jgi:hypothetical protein